MAEKAGYTNTKVYVDGNPAWKKAGKLIVVKNTWIGKNLDHHRVIIDIRPESRSSESHIKTAVALYAGKIVDMGEGFKSKRVKISERILPLLVDKKAPIILYGQHTRDPDTIAAYQSLVSQWRYKNVAILDGGFTQWIAKDLPVESGPAGTKIAYVKKLVKGAVSPANFKKFQASGEAVILDIRTDQELAAGKIPNAIHIPCDTLEANLGKLSKSDKIFIHCSTGIRAEIAYNTLKNKGFTDVSFLNSVIVVDKSGKYKIDAETTGGVGVEISPIITAKTSPNPSDKALCALMIRAGREKFDRGRFQEAKDFFRKAVQADPHSARAWYYYETCLINAWAVEMKNKPVPPAGATTSDPTGGGTTRGVLGVPASAASMNDEGC